MNYFHLVCVMLSYWLWLLYSGLEPTSGVVFIFGQAGLQVVQVSPQIVLLQFVADRLHLGQLFQQRLVLLLYQLESRQGWKVQMLSCRQNLLVVRKRVNHFAAGRGESEAGTSALQTFIRPLRFCWSLRLLLISERGRALRGVFQALGGLTVEPAVSRSEV